MAKENTPAASDAAQETSTGRVKATTLAVLQEKVRLACERVFPNTLAADLSEAFDAVRAELLGKLKAPKTLAGEFVSGTVKAVEFLGAWEVRYVAERATGSSYTYVLASHLNKAVARVVADSLRQSGWVPEHLLAGQGPPTTGSTNTASAPATPTPARVDILTESGNTLQYALLAHMLKSIPGGTRLIVGWSDRDGLPGKAVEVRYEQNADGAPDKSADPRAKEKTPPVPTPADCRLDQFVEAFHAVAVRQVKEASPAVAAHILSSVALDDTAELPRAVRNLGRIIGMDLVETRPTPEDLDTPTGMYLHKAGEEAGADTLIYDYALDGFFVAPSEDWLSWRRFQNKHWRTEFVWGKGFIFFARRSLVNYLAEPSAKA